MDVSDIPKLVDYFFNPGITKPLAVGLSIGAALGAFFTRLFFKERLSLAQDEAGRLRQKLEEIKHEVSDKKAEAEKQKEQNDHLRKSIPKTISCSICGSGVRKVREYQHPAYGRSQPYVDLQCTGERCGQIFPMSTQVLKQLMIRAHSPKR